ncbi:SecA regulator SecM [Mangrovibacter sp. MFB070]|uniref:secA translation cis-regulator SecM n=1 Tax=Mangrovibacter sp. MFB070 TaxID=1224318 RepID=UPI0004DAA408|nr:secA translation cis-regulator SecM [Mangrovibacter sp. MFB070]KEA53186.1 SecA regulator SecM [Mangrovibacter sp. MFB070]
MSGIFARWRQLGRRYFWPHLLLGMVAASFGLPVLASSSAGATTPAETTANYNRFNPALSLAQLQESNRRQSTFSVDYWHQHAIRTVIRHLTFVMAPQVMAGASVSDDSPLEKQHIALLDTLSALLTQESKPPSVVRQEPWPAMAPSLSFTFTNWLGTAQGIRAGPQARC